VAYQGSEGLWFNSNLGASLSLPSTSPPSPSPPLSLHYSGAPGARGPRFIEPPEPPVPTPLSGVSRGRLSRLCQGPVQDQHVWTLDRSNVEAMRSNECRPSSYEVHLHTRCIVLRF